MSQPFLGFPSLELFQLILRKCGVGVYIQKLTSSGLSNLFQQEIKELPSAPRTDFLHKCNHNLYEKTNKQQKNKTTVSFVKSYFIQKMLQMVKSFVFIYLVIDSGCLFIVVLMTITMVFE